MKCSTCMWFVAKVRLDHLAAAWAGQPMMEADMAALDLKPGKIELKPEQGPTLGRCRRYAPTMNGWPAVFSTDWCGNHKMDENKI